MKVKTLSALAGLGGALILSSSADAAFLGLELVDVSAWMSTVGPTNIRAAYNAAGGPGSYQIYRLFAKFDNTGVANFDNRVNAISGLVGNTWSFNLIGGSVRNYTTSSSSVVSHFNLPAGSATAGQNAAIGWDTWFTLGTQFGANTHSYSPGAHVGSQLNNFQGNYSANDAALFITPDDTQGRAIALNSTTANGLGGSGFGVLIGQIVVSTGSLFSGTLNLNVGGNALAPTDVLGLTYTNVPAPGALALLGLAGLVGGRRRRS